MNCSSPVEAQQVARMRNTSDTERLAEAVANLATTITEIIEVKIRESAQAPEAGEPPRGGINMLTPAEGWVDKKGAAEHLKISRRTLYDWMKKGGIIWRLNSDGSSVCIVTSPANAEPFWLLRRLSRRSLYANQARRQLLQPRAAAGSGIHIARTPLTRTPCPLKAEQEGGSDQPALGYRFRQHRRANGQPEQPRVRAEQVG